MYVRKRRLILLLLIIAISVLGGVLPFLSTSSKRAALKPYEKILRPGFFEPRFEWRNLPQRHPLDHLTTLPSGQPVSIPKIQYNFQQENVEAALERKRRLEAVKEAFVHTWKGYQEHAWLHDEVSPLSGSSSDNFGGWGATLVDSLDTLWIMGMKKEFHQAVSAIKNIDFRFPGTDRISVFETTIRYLGGLLSAYDVSGQKHSILLHKAIELGDMLYVAFDTPNRMPITRWDWQSSVVGGEQIPSSRCSIAEIGSLSLEFTRLSQLTGNDKWYDAIDRITDAFEKSQKHTQLPGLWPAFVNAIALDFTNNIKFTLGGMADSMYEYLPKEYLLLGGQVDKYRSMYLIALDAMKEHLFFRPSSKENRKMLIPGSQFRHAVLGLEKRTEGDHLGCFAGGMVALAAKAFHQPDELETAQALVEGCIWAAESMSTKIMPEAFSAFACQTPNLGECVWSEDDWYQAVANHAFTRRGTANASIEQGHSIVQRERLPPGFVEINDPRYLLRPESIESIFVLYRITGDKRLYHKAWEMFQGITAAAKTPIAYASIKDVTNARTKQLDSMESFWTAETLKYFFLIFSEPDIISLDEYVL